MLSKMLTGVFMSYKESDIILEIGSYFVLKLKDSYGVFVNGITHSVSDSFYKLDADGLSIAVARCKYLAKFRGSK